MTEIAKRALAAVAATNGTTAEIFSVLGVVKDWRTAAELRATGEVSSALLGLICEDLLFLSFPFREQPRYVLTRKGRVELAGVVAGLLAETGGAR